MILLDASIEFDANRFLWLLQVLQLPCRQGFHAIRGASDLCVAPLGTTDRCVRTRISLARVLLHGVETKGNVTCCFAEDAMGVYFMMVGRSRLLFRSPKLCYTNPKFSKAGCCS